ncbi:hypothetical protein N7G274_009979 [Stereocaulon virgatum]|uniref:Secreted protein n=1 Tax=Stereocaulon virgatum TaxID=373712 RepID=A0ABR3ZX02_9LECA
MFLAILLAQGILMRTVFIHICLGYCRSTSQLRARVSRFLPRIVLDSDIAYSKGQNLLMNPFATLRTLLRTVFDADAVLLLRCKVIYKYVHREVSKFAIMNAFSPNSHCRPR